MQHKQCSAAFSKDTRGAAEPLLSCGFLVKGLETNRPARDPESTVMQSFWSPGQQGNAELNEFRLLSGPDSHTDQSRGQRGMTG